MSIALKPETERQIVDHMKSGGYTSPDDVIHAALELLDEEKRQRDADLDDLRQQIAIGVAQLDRGEGVDGEQAFDELLSDLGSDQSKGRP